MKKLNSPNNIHHLAFLCRDAEQTSKRGKSNLKDYFNFSRKANDLIIGFSLN